MTVYHNSSHTGRYARSLEDAFGPHVRSSQCLIEPMPDAQSSFDRALPYLYAVALVAVGVVAFVVTYY